jgi:hypothetical protein
MDKTLKRQIKGASLEQGMGLAVGAAVGAIKKHAITPKSGRGALGLQIGSAMGAAAVGGAGVGGTLSAGAAVVTAKAAVVAAATAAGVTAAAPVVVCIAAVGGVAYGARKLYKWLETL